MYDRYIIIIIYENCTVPLASVGLAQACPKYLYDATMHCATLHVEHDDCTYPAYFSFHTLGTMIVV